MPSNKNPYENLPESSFWRPAVANKHFDDFEDIAAPLDISISNSVATAGSCFAQHIGKALLSRGARYIDLEPAPGNLSSIEAKAHGFGIYSCRYGNIYTARQLRQLIQEAYGDFTPGELVWERGGRYFDAMRPSVDPVGHRSRDIILQAREKHLEKVRELLGSVDVFIFTLGLTETWELKADGTVFPVCPGTIAGEFSDDKYQFRNLNYQETIEDMKVFNSYLQNANSAAKLLLTVSPVPLTATASGKHVLQATMYSKSTLRAVAGDLAAICSNVRYFPSYELITSHPMRGTFFNPDLRTVNMHGVNYVMKHFFNSISGGTNSIPAEQQASDNAIICDEEKLDAHASDRRQSLRTRLA